MSDTPSAANTSLPRLPCPDALRPHITIGPPNDPIPLYEGPTDFSQTGNTFRVDARVYLAWLPSPAVRFEVPNLPSGVYPALDNLSFRLNDGTAVSHSFVTGSHHSMGVEGESASLSGIVNERVTRPADGPTARVLFLLPNFQRLIGQHVHYPNGSSRASRLTLRGGGWLITIDAVDAQKSISEFLDNSSGFGITHVGRLEREDGTPFAAQDALGVLDALAWYASFAAGRWTGPCLPSGFDANGRQVWQVWSYSRTVPFRKRSSWLDSNHGEQ